MSYFKATVWLELSSYFTTEKVLLESILFMGLSSKVTLFIVVLPDEGGISLLFSSKIALFIAYSKPCQKN